MCRTLVFGASLKPERYSHIAVKRLQNHKFDTVAFGLNHGFIDNVEITKNLGELTNIDIVTLYLRPELQKKYYKYILGLQPKKVIFNPGTENTEFYEKLFVKNIKIEVACTLVLLATGQYGCD